jgi:hypothetical protein
MEPDEPQPDGKTKGEEHQAHAVQAPESGGARRNEPVIKSTTSADTVYRHLGLDSAVKRQPIQEGG